MIGLGISQGSYFEYPPSSGIKYALISLISFKKLRFKITRRALDIYKFFSHSKVHLGSTEALRVRNILFMVDPIEAPSSFFTNLKV